MGRNPSLRAANSALTQKDWSWVGRSLMSASVSTPSASARSWRTEKV